MYERIFQQKKQHSGKKLYVLLTVSVLICIITIVMAATILSREHRFKQFISDFSSSTSYAYSQGFLTATVEGRERQITGDDIYAVFSLVANCRGIKIQERPEKEPEVVLDFGDTSRMEFWTSKLKNPTNNRKYGLLIWYQNQTGEAFCYDTDRLDIDRVKLLMRRKVDFIKTMPTE